ncbi:MAG TPA: HRDC domain-containing protein [Candidatus Thermoplasmatota archaeon]|nr:HRDC domain-containing protein [Candidatus Thermoplasmatota archaeon]
MPSAPVRLPPGDALVEALATYRREAARRLGAPPWRVLPNATLLAIARERPRTRADLAGIPGLGPVRRRRHARAILAIVARRR